MGMFREDIILGFLSEDSEVFMLFRPKHCLKTQILCLSFAGSKLAAATGV